MTTKTPPVTMAIEEVPIERLRPDPANPRRISNEQLEALTRSLREFGFVQPVLARREDSTVVGGHQRLTAARRLGYKTVPVVWLDISREQARLLNVALNKISGDWDQELLGRLLADLRPIEDIDLSLSGFSPDELAKLLKSLDLRDRKERVEDFDYEEALKRAQNAPRAQPGQIWALGDHRLMCGDSTSTEDVARLFAGDKASLLATDPPYLVDYDSGERATTRGNRGKTQKHWDDYQDPQQSVDFYKRYLQAALPHLKPKTAFYQWHATIRQHLVMQAWAEVGLHLHQTIVWVKPRGVLTRSWYMWAHEPCFVGWLEGQQPERKPPANARTVWEIGGEHDNVHPTQKPLEVFLLESHCRKAIYASSGSCGVRRRRQHSCADIGWVRRRNRRLKANVLASTPVDTTKQAVRGGTKQSRLQVEAAHFDPTTGGVQTWAHSQLAYSRLVRYRQGTFSNPPDGSVEGDAAAAWEFSADGLQVTMKLRPNLRLDNRPPTSTRPR